MKKGLVRLMSPFITLLGLFTALVVVWLITSLAIFFAARIVVGSKAKFARALELILLGAVIWGVFSFIILPIITPIILGTIVVLIIVFFVWLWLIKTFFKSGWLGALGITFLAVFMFIVLMLIFGFVLALVGIPLQMRPLPIPTIPF